MAPGLAWVATEAKLPQFSIDQTSIRPAGVADIGFRLPLLPTLSFRTDARFEWMFADHEPKPDGSQINITG